MPKVAGPADHHRHSHGKTLPVANQANGTEWYRQRANIVIHVLQVGTLLNNDMGPKGPYGSPRAAIQ